jgi:hypothetical protein
MGACVRNYAQQASPTAVSPCPSLNAIAAALADRSARLHMCRSTTVPAAAAPLPRPHPPGQPAPAFPPFSGCAQIHIHRLFSCSASSACQHHLCPILRPSSASPASSLFSRPAPAALQPAGLLPAVTLRPCSRVLAHSATRTSDRCVTRQGPRGAARGVWVVVSPISALARRVQHPCACAPVHASPHRVCADAQLLNL